MNYQIFGRRELLKLCLAYCDRFAFKINRHGRVSSVTITTSKPSFSTMCACVCWGGGEGEMPIKHILALFRKQNKTKKKSGEKYTICMTSQLNCKNSSEIASPVHRMTRVLHRYGFDFILAGLAAKKWVNTQLIRCVRRSETKTITYRRPLKIRFTKCGDGE